MIADVQDINHVYQRTYTHDGHLDTDSSVHKLFMLTSDDRVAEAIEECATFYANSNKEHHMYPVFDLIVTPLVTGSKEYIEWVK